MINEELMKRFENQEEVYFENQNEELVFRANPKQGYQAKRKGGEPYYVQIGNKALAEAISEGKLISKAEFENY